MKKFAFILLIGALLASCAGKKDQFSIKGTISGVDSGMVYLQKYDSETGDWNKIDSVALAKGEFNFKGKIGLPEMWYINMNEKQIFVPLFVENADIQVKIYVDSVDKSEITGSATHDQYKSYLAGNDSLNKQMEIIYVQWKAAKESNDTLAMTRIDSLSGEIDKQLKKKLVDFAKNNPQTVVSPYIIIRNAWQFDLPDLEEIAVVFDTSLNGSVYTKALKKRIDILRSVQIGQIAPDFTMNDSLGKPVTLSSLKGKVLLVDFWASWCSPCRAENPNVVKAWKDFNKKGFDVLGVSFDNNREKWINAIKSDGLTWNHVSDLKGWGNAAGKIYGVNSIPANVLLDRDQKIIGRNLRGEELLKKLTEVLGPAAPEKVKKGKK